MKKIIFTIFLMLNVLWVYGQTQDPTKINVIHPSPEASAFKKYIDIPVNSYTGVPKIDIPIFTLQSGDISLPISLSYHAAGLKVEEQASRVGAGWTLNAGGSISRSVVGKPDENGFFNSNTNEFFGRNGDPNLVDFQKIENWIANCHYNTANQNTYLLSFVDGCFDTEPDEYYFNLPNGKSGRFGFDRLQNIRFFPNQYLFVRIHTFVSNPNPTTIWEMIDEAGYVYKFEPGKGEVTQILSNTCNFTNPGPCNQGDQQYATTYFLGKIINPTRTDSITFVYEDEAIDLESVQQTKYDGDPTLVNFYQFYNNIFCIQKTKVYGKRLKTINSSRGQRVEFIYDTQERLDLKGSKRLKTIQLFENQNLVKYFQLYQSYFLDIYEGYAPLSWIQLSTTSYDLHTLKLDSLQEFGKDNKSLPSHKFNYFRPSYSTDADRIPHRKCRDQDYWGYYNGAKNGQSMIPELRSLFVDRSPVDIYLYGANREVHTESAKIGVLEKITYPTGGFTTFEYESNDYSGHIRPEYARISRTKQILLTQSTSTQYSEDFDIVSALNPVNIQIKGEFPCINANGNILANCEASLMRLNPQNHSQVLEAFALVPGGFLKVPPGRYRIFGKLPQNQTMSMLVQIQWDDTGAVMENKLGGGLRIKQLNFFDAISPTSSFTKVYEYTEGNLTKSSGRQKSSMTFYYEIDANTLVTSSVPEGSGQTFCSWPPTGEIAADRLIVRTVNSYQTEEMLQGSPIGYGEVKEYTSPFKNNVNDFWRSQTGKVVSKFMNTPYTFSINGQGGAIISIPINKEELSKYGQLLNQTVYKYGQNGTYTKLKEIINQYDSLSYGFISGLRLAKGKITSCDIDCNIIPSIQYRDYYNQSKWHFLKNTKEILYDEANPSIALTTETQYEYNTLTQQIKKQTVLGNNNEKFITRYKYTIDYNYGSIPSLLALANKFILAAPIEEQTWIEKAGEAKMLSGKITEYDVNALKPSKIYLLETDAPLSSLNNESPNNLLSDNRYKHRATFTYNAQGNPIQQQKVDDITSAYLWGYNNQYPIAQAVNAPESEIAYTSFEESGKGKWNYTGANQPNDNCTGKNHYILNTGSLSKSGLSTTKKYKISLWAKGSGSITVNGSAKPATAAWSLLEWEISSATAVSISSSNSIKIDEVRLCPSEALMTTYTYDPLIGMTSQTDPNNQIIYYEYDSFGRLSIVKDDKGNILKQNIYHYKGE